MGEYKEVMTSGDHAPNINPGNLESNTLLILERKEIEAGGPMPPTKALKPELIDIIKRWIAAGAPKDAAALSAPFITAIPEGALPATPTP
jgi:hypothetical protein